MPGFEDFVGAPGSEGFVGCAADLRVLWVLRVLFREAAMSKRSREVEKQT